MLNHITPLILTYNEAPNIGRTLSRLGWAREIVVVDSGSTDDTLDILASDARVRVVHRPFDSHANQWNFGLQRAGVRTEWVLALDADFVLTDGFATELTELTPEQSVGGFRARFRYCTLGRPLRGALYPPITVLFRRERAHYHQDGHTQRVVVDGTLRDLRSPIFHDDRKSLDHWLGAQGRYAALEAQLLADTRWTALSWPDRLRRMYIVMPLLAPLYCLFRAGGLLDGAAGLHYALQRALAEIAIALRLLEYQSMRRHR